MGIDLFDTSGIGVPTSQPGRDALHRIEPFKKETLRVEFPARNHDFPTFSFFHLYINGRHHSLACIAISTYLAMIEHVPLPSYLADTAMRISTGHGRSYHIAFFIILARTGIDDCSAIGPGTQRMLAISVCQRIVAGVRQAIFTLSGSTAIDKHILILNLADGGCLKEAEYTFLPIA